MNSPKLRATVCLTVVLFLFIWTQTNKILVERLKRPPVNINEKERNINMKVTRLIQKIKVKERRYTEDILTVKEMMDYLAIGKRTAYKFIHDGTIKSFRIGRQYKVSTKSVKEYINNRLNNNGVSD